MGVKINYGLCQGGPFNKKHLADHRGVFPLAIDKRTRKAIPATIASADPEIEFGEYRFDGSVWIWQG